MKCSPEDGRRDAAMIPVIAHDPDSPSGLTGLLLKPYYYRRPSQVLRAVRHRWRGRTGEVQSIRLAFGVDMLCHPHETIGSALSRTGVFELATTELVLRLADPGERCLDIGANVGYMTAALATAVGPDGSVTSWEPHPSVSEILTANVRAWNARSAMGSIDVRRAAASSVRGMADLGEGDSFLENNGSAALGASGSTFSVATETLDQVVGDDMVGVMKIDVEGHELSVLQGARRILGAHKVRDVIFEEHGPPPTPVTELLDAFGYTVLRFWQGRFGVSLSPSGATPDVASWDAANYLATLDPERAQRRVARRGWQALAARRRRAFR